MEKNEHPTQRSRKLAYLLRHTPIPDSQGWLDVDLLIDKYEYSEPELERIVNADDKSRFEFSKDRTAIRARHGHSIQVERGLKTSVPPPVLFHETALRRLDRIRSEGVCPMSRKFVHLSRNEDKALEVGRRHGDPVVLTIDTGRMYHDGHVFYESTSGIWLTERIAPGYIQNSEPKQTL